MVYFYIYLGLVNLLAFLLAAFDKRAAIRRKQRIPEKTLFLWAVLGGSVGLYLSMLLFRHKTRHLSFMLGVPVIFIVQTVLFWYVTK
jgi:uncharacterized membrane protein YsdA (DUF1294 family)